MTDLPEARLVAQELELRLKQIYSSVTIERELIPAPGEIWSLLIRRTPDSAESIGVVIEDVDHVSVGNPQVEYESPAVHSVEERVAWLVGEVTRILDGGS